MQQKAKTQYLSTWITILCSIIWLMNGLYCKILNQVPRHKEIVGRILGEEYAELFTTIIGFSELLMVLWIVSGIKKRWCIYSQIAVVAAMNIIEFMVVPDLLLFGRANIAVACVFVSLLWYQSRLPAKETLS